MKRLLLSIVAATALCAPQVAAAVEIYGVWVRDGHPTDKLEFFDCQGKLCAKGVLPMLDGSPPPLVLRHAAKTGPNSWKGDLFNPEDGKTYTGKIAYEAPNQLTLTGCLVAFLCQSETWTRVSGPTKPAAPDAKSDAKGGAKAPAADAKAGVDKPADKGAAAAKPAVGQDAKASKPAKPADAKPAAPAKPATAKPAPKAGDDAQ
ncbi:DUF2147 domain-containing protein [Methylocystis parvus]|uniref:DUF2147 domain-containing protein n=1 Tax=Methylocystis parvus TaxID=134 RepID=A0A6B8LYK0_9HYPH|nr:DUF2147 domain-containing protein [Methylocystis parvus]QGM96544.1 DUF2147 domain-containing protein [Methylocystis parvus]WBJ99604.1 DUF2147 domain-containing protein [Methylocystis parvus OBBP]